MIAVSQELLAAHKEAQRESAPRGLARGTQLRSEAQTATAQESEAQPLLLQSQPGYAQAARRVD